MSKLEQNAEDGPEAAAVSLIAALRSRNLSIALAESCTGGLVAKLLTDIAGSSAAVWGGVVAYSNECKVAVLHIQRELIETAGAVSREIAHAMAQAVLASSGADLSIGITGIAGPTGGSPGKPVGLVWFGWATKEGGSREESCIFPGDRKEVRRAAAEHALRRAMEIAERPPASPWA